MKKNKIIFFLLIVFGLIAIYLYFSNANSTIKKELSDFSVEDTASVSKIFLADEENNKIILKRINPDYWTVNEKYEARLDAVNVLLTTIKRVSVKTPVPRAAFENVVKQIASQHVKIEIYQGSDEPVKSYYVGHSNQEHSGTYMLLENSSVPFLMHIEGFRGFLTPRYFTNENEWRSSSVFSYEYGEISEIRLEYTAKPDFSFLISEKGNNSFGIKSLSDSSEIIGLDSTILLPYVALFRKIHFEGFEETKNQNFIDSIKRTTPQQIISVKNKAGMERKLKTFLKPAQEGSTDLEGNQIKYDLERFYGLVDEKDFVVLQFYVFDPLLKKAEDFRKK